MDFLLSLNDDSKESIETILYNLSIAGESAKSLTNYKAITDYCYKILLDHHRVHTMPGLQRSFAFDEFEYDAAQLLVSMINDLDKFDYIQAMDNLARCHPHHAFSFLGPEKYIILVELLKNAWTKD